MTGECALRCEMRRMRLLPTTRHAAESTDSSIRTESFAATMVLDVWKSRASRRYQDRIKGRELTAGGTKLGGGARGHFPLIKHTMSHRTSFTHEFLSSTIPPPRFFTHSLSRQHNPSPFLTAPGTDPEKGFSPSAPALVALFASSLVQTCELEVDQPIALATMYPPA